jgi:hypothetical protein
VVTVSWKYVVFWQVICEGSKEQPTSNSNLGFPSENATTSFACTMSATMSSAYTYVSDTYRRVVVGDWEVCDCEGAWRSNCNHIQFWFGVSEMGLKEEYTYWIGPYVRQVP